MARTPIAMGRVWRYDEYNIQQSGQMPHIHSKSQKSPNSYRLGGSTCSLGCCLYCSDSGVDPPVLSSSVAVVVGALVVHSIVRVCLDRGRVD